ncbi:MAG: polyprenol monophosphomannose synthase [Leptospirales bacterium]
MRVSIIVPSYNEGENVRLLADRISGAMQKIDYELLFVDDSTDNTPRILEDLQKTDPRIKVIHRVNERGLGSAVVKGIESASSPVLACMDSDLQHPPEILPQMLSLIEAGNDIVIPSRFIPGGSDGGLLPHRKLVSWVARYMAKTLLKRVRPVSDPTSGYFMLKRSVVENISIHSISWKILVEILVKGHYSIMAEIPYTFRAREIGTSKMSFKAQLDYIRHLIALFRFSSGNPSVVDPPI